jgi:hypothetical protein
MHFEILNIPMVKRPYHYASIIGLHIFWNLTIKHTVIFYITVSEFAKLQKQDTYTNM